MIDKNITTHQITIHYQVSVSIILHLDPPATAANVTCNWCMPRRCGKSSPPSPAFRAFNKKWLWPPLGVVHHLAVYHGHIFKASFRNLERKPQGRAFEVVDACEAVAASFSK
jgi:hypothetical protein